MEQVGQNESGGGGQKTASAPPSCTPCARNLILTIFLASLPLILALSYQQLKINKTNKELQTYEQLLEELNNKKNLTQQEKQIKEDLESKLEEEPPNNNTNNNVKPTFGKKPWHRGSNSRRKTR